MRALRETFTGNLCLQFMPPPPSNSKGQGWVFIWFLSEDSFFENFILWEKPLWGREDEIPDPEYSFYATFLGIGIVTFGKLRDFWARNSCIEQHIQLECETTFKRCIHLTLSWHCYRISVDDIQGKTSKICVLVCLRRLHMVGMRVAIVYGCHVCGDCVWHTCGDCAWLPCLWRLCLAFVWQLAVVGMFVAIGRG